MRAILSPSAVLTIALLLCQGCEMNEDEPENGFIICGVKNPDWFMVLIEEIESDSLYYGGSIIYQHEYEGSYLFHLNIPLSSCVYCRLYDCAGNLVEWSSTEEFEDYLQHRTNETVVWP